MDFSKKYDNPNPRLTANCFSRLCFLWQIPLFRKGLHNDLEVNDLYNAQESDLSEPLGDVIERHWTAELANAKAKDRKPRLMKAITATFWKEYSFWGLMLLIQAVGIRCTLPVILGVLLRYFDTDSEVTSKEAYTAAAALVVLSSISTLIQFHTSNSIQIMGMRCRIACCSLLYRKMLRLSPSALGQTATGQVINLMSNDVNRFDMTPVYLHYIWIMPIQAVIISYFMWRSVGVSAFAGVAVIAAQAVPLQGMLSRKTARLRLHIAHRTDERVRLMNEIISGIQVIKMYAWEKPFDEIVKLARKLEIDLLLITSYIRGFSLALMVYTERLSLYVTIISFVLLGNDLTGDKVFSMAQFYNTLQLYMAIFFPLAIVMGGEARVSVKRLETFLLQEENIAAPITNGYIDKENCGQISIKNGIASWTPTQIIATLCEINLNLKPGALCAIIGPVGSGKSSILQMLLSELPLNTGTMSVSGKLSYCSQEPWLFQSTVRNNILFGLPYDKHRYSETVRVCALVKDFEQLPNGDKTLVGDRGASLSGGQKARVNLARAVYRQADIYLLDDPLSAVDTHVGKHLFDQCISDYLSKHTRILVTHQLQYLKAADIILVLNNGRIERQGNWDEISESSQLLEGILENQEEHAAEEMTPRKRLLSELSVQSGSPDDELEEPEETQELMEKGQMKSNVFFAYLRAGGSIFFLCFLFIFLIIAQGASSGADYWVTIWTNQEETRRSLILNTTESVMTEIVTEISAETTTWFEEETTTMADIEMNFTTEVNSSRSTPSVEEPPYLFSQETCIYVYSVFIAGSVILTTLSRLIFYKLCMNASRGLHDTMFSNILQSTMRFFDTNPAGRILNRFSKDMGAIDELLPRALIEAVQIFLVMSGILVMVALVQPYLIIAMVIMGAIFNRIRTIYLATAQDIKRLEGITRSPVFSHVSASLDGLTTIRSCGAQGLLQREFDQHQDLHTGAWYLTIATSIAFGFWLDCVSITFMALVSFSFLLLDDGNTFSGNVGLAISQSLILTGMLQYGMRQTAEVMSQMTSVERVLQYTKLEKEGPFESEPGKKPPSTWPGSGKIEFKHTFLSYAPNDPPVLKDLNILIDPGTKVGIVGRTGAGKSSLISALFRLAPLEGEICIDNIVTNSVGLSELRSRVAIIPQTPVLFSASLRHNLDPLQASDDASLWRALDEVELKDVAVSLDHKVNEGGSNFSAGQRQLLCLARAIVRNNKILVLDEATANVDPQTDALIQTTIRTKFASCTVLTIAHRLNTIMDSDKVLVMEAGRMVEFDHPHILLQQEHSYFSKMVAETGKVMEQQLRKVAKEAYDAKSVSSKFE